jgi:hypothetical protein
MLYAAMFDHVSLPAKLPFEKEDVGDPPKSSSSQKNENGELLVQYQMLLFYFSE